MCDRVARMSLSAAQPEEIPLDRDYSLIVRSAELCNPFLDALGEVTLSVRGPVASSVLNWNASLFSPVIRPALMEAFALAAEGGSFEITALDCRLDAALPKQSRLTSRGGGKRLIQGLLAPRGDRVIERYRSAVLAGDSPGHLAVIHALRAFLFHLPPQVVIASYLLQEGVGAGLDGREIGRFLIGGICASEGITALTPPSDEVTVCPPRLS